MKTIHLEYPGHPEATLEGILLDGTLTLGQDKCRPAVLVCPGGGYVYCADSEAEPVALAYANKGFHAFILRYSTGYQASGFLPLQQASWAIGLMRQHAQEWNIDPNKIIVCGFSAGGHLALSTGLLAEHKPNAMVLGYPVTSAPAIPAMDFMLKFLTGKETVTAQDAERFDLLPKITRQAPPVFLMATAQDALTPFGALAVAKRYSDLGLGYEVHIFQYGPHGYSLARETSVNGSARYLDPDFAQWHDLSVDWIFRTLGKPEFTDKSNSRMAQYLKDLGIELKGF